MDYTLFKAIAEDRSKIYWFLGTFYLKKPDVDFLKELKIKFWSLEDRSLKDAGLGVEILKKALESEKTLEELSYRLAVEFTRLFRGVRKGYGPSPPYESVYRDEGKVMGETTLAVMRHYAKAGFGIIDEYAGPQDYIGTELKFMSFLCYKEMEAWGVKDIYNGNNYLKMEKSFLEDHILKWVPRFCSIVERETREVFYAGVAKLTMEFLEIDMENVDHLLKETDLRDL